MNFFILKLFSVLCCLASCGLFADDIHDSSTGATFPKEISFEQNGKQFQLNATGVATRKKFFVKVYSVAHYLQTGANTSGSDKFQTIMQDNVAKQLTLKWVHEASADKVQEGYVESFKKTLSQAEYAQIESEINQFVKFFSQNIQKGNEHIIRWTPGGYIEVLINGNKAGSITNSEFAKELWGIWFGSKSVVDRNNLVSLMK